MGMAPVYLDTMYDAHPQSTNSGRTNAFRDRTDAGGVVAYSLAAVGLTALVVAPVVTVSVALLVAVVAFSGRLSGLVSQVRGEGGLSPPESDSSRPA
jgi:hypothetical protein